MFYRIMMFFTEVFLDIEKENQFHIQEIVVNILKLLIGHFKQYINDYVDSMNKKEGPEIYYGGYEVCKTKDYYIKKGFLALIHFYDNLIRIDIHFSRNSEGAIIFTEFVDETLMHINKHIKTIKDPEINTKLKGLKSNLLVSVDDANNDFQKENAKRSILDSSTEPKNVIHNAFNQFQKRKSTANAMTLVPNVVKKESKDIDSITSLIKKLTKNYFKSESFTIRCNKEFMAMVNYVTNIETNPIVSAMNIQKINFKGYCIALISYLMPSDDMVSYNIYDTIMSLK